MNKKDINFADKFLVAGSKGMVGSAICRALKEKGYGNKEKYSGEIFSPSRRELDYLDYVKTAEWFKKMRYDGRPSIYYNDILFMNVKDIGYHMYMAPEQAVMGIQNFYALNKNRDSDSSCSADYQVDLSKLECFNEDNSIR